MRKLLEPDGLLIRFLTRVCDLILLSIMTTICCVTIVCSGAALTALYSITLRMSRNEEGEIFKAYFRKVRENFIPSVPATLLLFVDVMLLALVYHALYAEVLVFSPFVFVLLAILAAFLTAVLSYVFPLLARFENTFPQHLGNAVRLALVNLPVTFMATLVNLLPFLIVAVFPGSLIYVISIWPLIGVAAGANLNSFFLHRIFKQ